MISCALTEAQARRVWEEIKLMRSNDRTGRLDLLYKFLGGARIGDEASIQIKVPGVDSFFRAVGNQTTAHSLSGIIPNFVLFDEAQFYPSDRLQQTLRGGVKNRTQPIVCTVQNAGTYRGRVFEKRVRSDFEDGERERSAAG